jgi:predicted DNA-binding protein YlxM (UPF0122 family)
MHEFVEFIHELPDILKGFITLLLGALSSWVAFYTAKERASRKKAEAAQHELKNTEQETQQQAVTKRSQVMGELVEEMQSSIHEMQEELRAAYSNNAKSLRELTEQHNKEVRELKDEINKLRKELNEFEARINQERRSLLTITAELENAHRTVEQQRTEIAQLQRTANVQEAYLLEAQQHVDKYALVLRCSERRKNLPHVELDEMEQQIRFYGSSTPDNHYAERFFRYIERLVDAYFCENAGLRVLFSVSHLNSKSQALVHRFISHLAEQTGADHTDHHVAITWLCEENDDDMLALGESFRDAATEQHIPFDIQTVARLHEAKFSL